MNTAHFIGNIILALTQLHTGSYVNGLNLWRYVDFYYLYDGEGA